MSDSSEDGSVGALLSQADDAALPSTPVTLPPLRHREGGELGRGGMARVTSGFDPVLARPVALKRSLRGTPEEDAQLLREARLTARLDHPAVAAVLDVGLDPRGALVCVLHVRQGTSFADAVRAARPGPPPAKLLRDLLSASQAVAHAHARGVVHRDLSATNVRLSEDGAVWVLDWGLAATVDEAARGGFRGGTAGTTAPEQREGRPTSPASDVWSLGALLHLLCAGSLPLPILAHSAPPRCPRPLWALCRRALAEHPEDRYPDARAFAEELARWLDGQPLLAWPEGPLDRLARIAGRRPRLTFALVSVVLLVTSAGAVATSLVLRATETARQATATLLTESAERALAADDVVLARQLATQALASRDDARARGVLATLARVALVERAALPPATCEVLDVGEGGVACRSATIDAAARLASGVLVTASQATSSFTVGGETVSLPGGTPTLATNRARDVAVLWVPEGLTLISGDSPGPVLAPCTPGQPIRFAVPRDEAGALVFCADDELVEVSRAAVGKRARVVGVGSLLRGPVAGDLIDAQTLIVGTADGHVGVIDLNRAELEWVGSTGLGLIWAVVASGDGSAAALIGDRGAGLFRLAEGHVLPVSGALSGVWRRGPRGFVAAERSGALFELTALERLSVTKGIHGRAALAVHDVTGQVAVGDSFGQVQLARLESGVHQTIAGVVRVIKSLSFSGDGRFLALGAAGPDGLLVFDLSRGSLGVPGPWMGDATIRARHVAFLDATHLVYFGWGAPPRGAGFDAALGGFVELPVPAIPGDIRDLAAREGELWAVDAKGGLYRISLRAGRFHSETVQLGLGAERIAVSPDGTQRAVSSPAGSWRLAPRTTLPRAVSAPIDALAIADDGRLALCRRDGVVELRGANDELLLDAPAHEQRCARVSFCDAQRAICSVGWDGRLRVMDAR